MGVVEEAKSLVKLAHEAGNLELYEKMLDLQGQVNDLSHEKWQLEQRVRDLEAALAFKGNMTFDAGVYWNVDSEGEREGPYCSRCWDAERLAIHLIDFHNGGFMCRNCDKSVRHDAATPRSPRSRGRRGF